MVKQSLQQSLQQKLSPQQIQLMKLIELSTLELEQKVKDEIGQDIYSNGKFDLAVELFSNMITSIEFDEFLTLPAYKYI